MRTMLSTIILAAAIVTPAPAAKPGATRACAVTVFTAYKRAGGTIGKVSTKPQARRLDAAAQKLIVMAATEAGVGLDNQPFKNAIDADAMKALAFTPKTAAQRRRAIADQERCIKLSGVR